MRNTILLDDLKENYKEQYAFLMEKKDQLNSRGEKCFFIGFRDGYLCLYYKGMRVARIFKNEDVILYDTSDYYLEGIGLDSPLTFEQFKGIDVFSNIICQIEKHVTGKHGEKHRHQREKVCQQWIANMNNSLGNEWFFVDMEYVYDKDPYGRPDLIAVRRRKNKNEKHDVALIELKIRHQQYTGLSTQSYEENKELYEILARDLYDKSKEVKELKFGSGIVSHLADYLRFLKDKKNYQVQMREEIIGMIQGNLNAGLIKKGDELAKITQIDQLEDKPLIYILTYSYTPYHPGEKEKKAELKSMKQSLYNVMYGKRTPFGLKDMLNNSQVDGLLADEVGFKKAIKDDSVEIIERTQEVNGIDYKFMFVFKDPDDTTKEPWDCLP